MAALELSLFGPPRLERDGKTVRFETKKALALLAYLAVEGPQSRERLGDLFWPEHDAEHARGALRRTLSAIRSASGDPELLAAERTQVAVVPERIRLDVIEFRSALSEGRAGDAGSLERAVQIARADVLSGLALRDAPEFEHWQYRLEESLRKEFGSALAHLVELRQTEGNLDAAIAHARTWVELDPLHEPAHQSLIRLYSESGDRAAAIDQYRACVRILSEELAVAPLEETTRLYEAITVGAEAGPRPTATIGAADLADASVEELPLIGRLGEEAALRGAVHGSGRLIVIEGEPGIGKTRLANFLGDVVEQAGHRGLIVRSHEEESGHAFGVASRLLHRALEGASTSAVRGLDAASATEASRLIPELRDLRDDLAEPASLDSPGAQTSFFHGIWETLVALGGDRAAVIVDDVQWCDRGTVELLAYGIHRLERLPVSIALTWRRDDVGPDHVMRHVLADARRDGIADVLSPERLDEREVAQLVQAVGAGGSELAERLFQETEGVPFFIAEYLKAAGTAAGEWPVAAGVRDLVRAQVARLSGVSQQVMTAAAVVGRDLTIELLDAVSGRAPEEVADAVEELERRGLLVTSGGARASYDFSHEKVRRVVTEDTSLARRRLLHGRAAQHLEHRGEIALAAYHAREAGRETDAARMFAIAGEQARQLFANEDALRHLEAALALGHPQAATLHEAIGNIHTLMGRYGDARVSYEAALAFASDEGTAARLERLLGSLFLRRGEAVRAEGHLRRAAESSVPADASRALAELALAVAESGNDDPLQIAERALVTAEEADEDAALARAYSVTGLLLARAGNLDDARYRLTHSVERAADLPDPSAHVAALNNLALVERDAGDAESALDLLDQAIKLSEKQGDLHRVAALHNNAADVLHDLGRTEESQAHSRAAAELFARVGEDPTREPGIWKLVSW